MVALMKMPSRLKSSQAERRVFVRKQIQLRVQGRRMDHTIDALRAPLVSLSTEDVSLGGLAATVDQPMEPGERLSVFFPPQGAKRGWDAYGRVLRCAPSALGWRIAVEFDPLPAA